MTERRLKLSQVFSLAFVALILAFAMVSFLPGDDGLLTDSVAQSPPVVQVTQ